MAKRILLTGGSGFVGANLARRLLAEGHDVRLILRPNHDPWRLAGIDPSTLHLVDLSDAEGVARAVKEIRPEWVFHLAAHGAYSSQRSWSDMLRTNITGTVNLVEACLEAGFESFINTGSSSEYGFKDHASAETELVEPNSHYAVAKAAATLYCGFIARTRNVRVQTLRLYSVYGPWEEPTRLIPTLIVRGLRGELPSLVDPTVARDFVYTEDVCSAYLAAAADSDAPAGAIFNVGTGRQSTLESLVGIVRRLLGVTEEPTWGSMPSRSWDTSTWVADISAARQELNWAPGRSLEAGLAETVQWFRSNPSMLALYEERINTTSASR